MVYRPTKIYLSLSFLSLALIFSISFLNLSSLPTGTVYIILSLFFSFSLLLSIRIAPSFTSILLLELTTFCLLFLVIDPVELGLFGFDTFHSLLTVNELISGRSISELMIAYRDRPALSIITTVLIYVTGASPELVAKYLPMVNLFSPIMVFLLARVLTDNWQALLVSYGFISFRIFFRFESKFVPESIALPLFFTSLFVFFKLRNRGDKALLSVYLLTSIAVIFSHSVTSAALIMIHFLMTLWTFREDIFEMYLRRKNATSRPLSPQPYTLLLILMMFTLLFIYIDTVTFRVTLLGIIGSIEIVNPGFSGDSSNFLSGLPIQIAGHLAYGSILLYSVLNSGVIFPSYDVEEWELPLLMYNGILVSVFGFYVLFGDINISIHPVRLLIFCIPTLLLIGNRVILSDLFSSNKILKKRIVMALVILFATVQFFLVPSHILYSSPGEPRMAEDNLPVQSRAASNWVFENSDREIVGYKSDLWRYYQRNDFIHRESISNYCSAPTLLVDRSGVRNKKRHVFASRIYSNGPLSIESC